MGNTSYALRDRSDYVRWHNSHNSPEENRALGIKNIQFMFLTNVPEFGAFLQETDRGFHVIKGQEKAAKLFILDRFRTTKDFVELFGNSPLNRHRAPYFEGSRSVALSIAFGEWGISLDNEPITIRLHDNGITQLINSTSEDTGSESLRKVLDNELSFSEVKPFVIDRVENTNVGKNRINGGRLKNGKRFIIVLNKRINTAIANGQRIFAYPKIDSERGYEWVDFYQLNGNEVNISDEPLGSYRVNIANSVVETMAWYGPNRQVLHDYMSGREGIGPELLLPFSIRVTNDLRADIATVHGVDVSFSFKHPRVIPGSVVHFVPFHDERGYVWLEGFVKDEDGRYDRVCTRRILHGDTRFHEWHGQASQTIIDWVHRRLPIDKTLEVAIENDKKSSRFTLEEAENSELKILLGNIKNGVTYTLRAREDDLYRWIDLVEKSVEGKEKITECRVLDQNGRYSLDARWFGHLRQRCIDYLEGIVEDNKLLPFTVSVSRGNIYLFSRNGAAASLNVGHRSEFSEGDEVHVVPRVNNGVLFFEFIKDGSLLAECLLNKQRKLRLVREGAIAYVPKGYWTPEAIEREAFTIAQNSREFSSALLRRLGLNKLVIAISRKYPGGMDALKEKLSPLLEENIINADVYFDSFVGGEDE